MCFCFSFFFSLVSSDRTWLQRGFWNWVDVEQLAAAFAILRLLCWEQESVRGGGGSRLHENSSIL